MIATTPIDRKLVASLKRNINKSNDLTRVINKAIAQYCNDKSYGMIIDELYDELSTYSNNINFKKFHKNNNSICSDKIIYNEFEGFVTISLTSGIKSVGLRFKSISSILRDKLEEDMNKNNVNLTIIKGAKHTEIGLQSRVHSEIDKATSTEMFNVFLDIIRAVGGVKNLK